MHHRTLILTCLLICLGVTACFGMSKIPFLKEKPASDKTAATKDLAQDFTLQYISGEQVTLSDLKGKFVFLHFWASWCPPCKEELPSIQKLYQASDKGKFVILAVNVKEGRGVIKPFLDERRLTFPVLLDPKAEVSRLYRVRSIPTTFLVNQEGQIIGKISGARDWKWEDFKPLLK
jgi:thiol-disulfide isomerase/thioredoxin